MEKCIYAFNYVDLKNREYLRKHTKQRHLGDVDGRYRYRPRSCTPTLVGSLVNLELPESRAINTSTAKAIIANQTRQIHTTYEKTNRTARLDAWSYPPLCEEKQAIESSPRPHTAGAYERGSERIKPALRPFSTGSPGQRVHPHTPPQLQSYMVAKLKRRHSSSGVKNIALKTVTTSLQAEWEAEDRKETQSPRRIKSQNAKRFDSFAGQWLSFAGGTEDDENGGVLDAFTGEAADEYYNVKALSGANIASQLNKGNKIRVGKNGVLQSNSLKVNKWKSEIQQDRSMPSDSSASCSTLDSWGNVKRKPDVTAVVPLSWEDQLDKPDVKVIDVKDMEPVTPKPDLCERHPVVFEKLVKSDNLPRHKVKLDTSYQIRQRTKSKRNIDGTESLNNRITMITVDEVKNDRDSMCSEEYEELLQRSLQTADLDQVETPAVVQANMTSNEEIGQDPFKLSPPAPSLANESQDTFVSSDMSPSQSSPFHLDLRHSNASPEGFIMKHESPSRLMSAASTTQRSNYIPSTPRQIARPVPSAPIMSARTRSQRLQAETPKRAQSSPTRRKKHQFDEPVTPRNIHSPRPNLVKPGQLPRSGVASINASSQDGEQEYIQISQQILPPSHGRRSYSALARVSETNRSDRHNGTELTTVFDGDSVTDGKLESDTLSIDSMNVNKGDPVDRIALDHDAHRHDCTCSPEIKRVLSAALSHLSHTSDPTAVRINIPTAENTESDRNSNPGSSRASFYSDRSDPLEGYDSLPDSGRQTPTNHDQEQIEQPSLENSSKPSETNPVADDQIVNSANVSQSSTTIAESRQKQEVEFFINQIDGLSFNQSDIEQVEEVPSRSHSASKKKRSVKFADEQGSLSPSVPQCTPTSTPRECNSDAENG